MEVTPLAPVEAVEPRTVRFGSIEVELFRSTRDLRLATHRHEHLHYCLPVQGLFYEADGKHEVLLESGLLRASPPGDRHRIRFGPEAAECLLILESRESTGRPRQPLRSRRFLRLGRGPRLVEAILDEMKSPDLVSPLIVEEAVLELEATSLRPPRAARHAPRWLRDVREQLAAEPMELLSLTALAAGAGVHRSQLVRAFRNHFGCSIGGFLRRRRLTDALRQIATSSRPLSQIAADCGFSDQSHLTRQVRELTGQPPGRLRRRLGSGPGRSPSRTVLTGSAGQSADAPPRLATQPPSRSR